jgi:hypothetical protein
MLLLTEKEIKMLGETILEAIDAKVSPLIEKVERIEKLDRVSQADLQNLHETLKTDLQAASCDDLKTFMGDTGKKFRVTAKIIGPLMRVLRKQSSANVCDKDIKGLALLMDEPLPETEGLNKDQLNELFEKVWKET